MGSTDTVTPDPVTGLTESDCKAIMDTWALVSDRKSVKENGVEFFMALFKAYPYMQNHFSFFQGKSLEELRYDNKLKSHAVTTMNKLSSYVGSVHDSATLAALVTNTAKSHVSRGVAVQDFENLALVFLDFMKSSVGSQWTLEVESAWRQLLAVHNTIVRQIEEQT